MRFLELAGASFEGNSEGLLKNLRWHSWHKCPESFQFSLKNLVILDLSQSIIDENWTGWSKVQILVIWCYMLLHISILYIF